MNNSFRFPKSRRLLKAAEFDRVFKRRRSQSDGLMVVYACENEVGYPRLGLVVSRKYGRAVTRNQWKRRLREAFRLAQRELPASVDLVVLPRAGAVPEMTHLQRSLLSLARRAAARLNPHSSSAEPPES